MSAARRKEKASTAGGTASDDAATRPPRDTTDNERNKERMVDGKMSQVDAEVKPAECEHAFQVDEQHRVTCRCGAVMFEGTGTSKPPPATVAAEVDKAFARHLADVGLSASLVDMLRCERWCVKAGCPSIREHYRHAKNEVAAEAAPKQPLGVTEKRALVEYLAHLHALGVGRARALHALEALGAAGLLAPQLVALLARSDLPALLGVAQKPGPRPKKITEDDVRAALAAHGTRAKAAESLGLSLRTFERIIARQKTT